MASVENWFDQGYSVGLASRLEDGTVGVSVEDFDDLASAVDFARGVTPRLLVAGRALAEKDELVRAGARPVTTLVRIAVSDLRRFANEGAVRARRL